MAHPIAAPIICPILIGRDRHLAALQACLDAAIAGQGQTVLIGGEAGIGKTRLAGAAVTYARAHGMRVLTGQCFEPDRALPYAPWRDLVRSHLLEHTWAAECLDGAEPLADIFPELARGGTPTVSARRPDPEQDRRRIVQGFLGVITILSAQSPLLVIVEDAHWSDEASLDLLLSLARRLHADAGIPVALLVTFRNDETSPALAATLAALDRQRLASEARLGPLPRAEVMAMLRAMSLQHEPVTVETTEAIFRLSEGNPFFVEELFRSTVAIGHEAAAPGAAASHREPPAIPLPRTIAEAVRQRVERLTDGARETLTLGAVSGRRFDFALLQAVSGHDEAELIAHIKELIGARLVVEESADGFAFHHALIRQAVYDELLARERRVLHQRILETMLGASLEAGDPRAADLARHAAEAGAWAEALAWGQRGGERALALYAPGAAVELFDLAIAAAAHLQLEPASSLVRSRGQAHELLGAFAVALADYEMAVALARPAGDGPEEVEALLALGALWAGRNYDQAGPYVEQALDRARAVADRGLIVRALNRLANWHANRDELEAALRLHEEALVLAEALGDPARIAETLDLIGMARYLGGDFIGSAAACQQAIPLLRALDDRRTLVNTLTALAFSTSILDARIAMKAVTSRQERVAVVEEALAVAREIDGRAEEALAHCCVAQITGERCLDIALEHAEKGLRIAEEIGHRQWSILAHHTLEYLYRLLLDVTAARQHLDSALTLAREIRSRFWIRVVLTEFAILHLLDGNPDLAEQTILETINDDTPMRTQDEREAWLASAQIALARGDPRRAVEIVDQLLHVATPDSEPDLVRLPHLALLRSEALTALGSLDEAATALAAARDGAMLQQNLHLLWHTHLASAAHARARGQREAAAREIAAAHATVQEIARGITDPSVREAFLQRAAAHLPPLRSMTPRQKTKAAFGGLTVRERQVAALVAAGQSNREIGEALFLTERTAATHVGNILSKLGLRTRAQIAAWAQERGLAAADGA